MVSYQTRGTVRLVHLYRGTGVTCGHPGGERVRDVTKVTCPECQDSPVYKAQFADPGDMQMETCDDYGEACARQEYWARQIRDVGLQGMFGAYTPRKIATSAGWAWSVGFSSRRNAPDGASRQNSR